MSQILCFGLGIAFAALVHYTLQSVKKINRKNDIIEMLDNVNVE